MVTGYEDGDEDAEIKANITIYPNERNTEVYWIVQREFVIRERDRECPDNDCYEAGRLRRVGDTNTYTMTLTFDEITREDIR